jgi:hypothetical protein
MVLPGRTAANVRVKASVLLTRFLGGDVTLVSEVYGMNELHNYLREHHPEHPLAAFRQAVEVGQTSQDARASDELRAKRASVDILEVRVETFVACHEAARRLGLEPDDRTRLQLRDMVQSTAIPTTDALSRAELCVRAFLLGKKANVALHEMRFGKAVAALKRTQLREAGLPEELPTKTIYANGQLLTDWSRASVIGVNRSQFLYHGPTPSFPLPSCNGILFECAYC